MKRIVLISLILLAAASQAARADIIVLWADGSGDYPTIQAAIDDAADGDVIYLFPGTYTGPNNTDIGFRGKSITVQSVAPDFPSIVAATIIDCNASEAEPHQGFHFYSYEDANAVVNGLTITNGYAVEGGGAIKISNSSPTISYCTITDCSSAGDGGAISCYESEPVIINCTFTDNSAAGNGGGVECHRTRAIIENCTFSGNLAQFGGGLYSNAEYDLYIGDLTLADCNFIGNSAAEWGGGIYCWPSNAIIQNCTFSGNSAQVGGGIMGWDPRSTLKITNSTFSHNTSNSPFSEGGTSGGAIFWAGPDIRLNGCTISANKAPVDGGGIYLSGYGYGPNRAIITNSKISGNAAGQNGGGIFDGIFELTVVNCIVSGNVALQSGAGLYSAEGTRTPEIINTTFADNWARKYGGGIYDSSCNRLFTITNSIFWGNADNSGTGLPAQLYACDIQVDAYATFNCIQDDNPDDANIPFGADPNFNIDDDPSFVMRGFWADANALSTPVEPNYPNAVWVEGDYHLLIDSPCIDAGSSDVLPPSKIFSIDFDAEPRVIGLDADMGADEFGRVISVNSPQEGDVWVGGSSHQINWYSYQTAGTVDISYSSNNGASWVPIETAVPDTGTYTWLVPTSVSSTQSLVQVIPTILEPNVIIIDSAPFTIHPDFVHPPVPSQWPSLAGGFDRSSLSENFGPEVGCIRWQFQTDSPVISSVTAGPGGRTHIACQDGKLYTLDSAGSLVWTFDANSPILCAPTVGPRGSLYVGTEDGILYAVSIAGTIRWTHRTSGFIWSSPAVSPEGNVYVGSADGRLYALANNGTPLWTFQTDARGDGVQGSIFASPAIAPDGTVYIGGLYDPNLYALDPDDGTVKWVCNFEHIIQEPDGPVGEPQEQEKAGWPFASPVVASDGTIYQGLLYDGEIYAIEPTAGSISRETHLAGYSLRYGKSPGDAVIWYGGGESPEYVEVEGVQREVRVVTPVHPAYCWTTPALGPDDTIYVTFEDDPFLRALDPNGTIRWVRRIGIMGGFTFAVGADGLIYVASEDGHLTVLDTDGTEIARFRGAGPLRFPVIADDGTIIITEADNVVKKIAASGCDGLPAALHRPEDLAATWIVNNVDFAILADHWLESLDLDLSPDPYDPFELPSYDDAMPTYLQGDINRDLAVTWLDLKMLTDRWLTSD